MYVNILYKTLKIATREYSPADSANNIKFCHLGSKTDKILDRWGHSPSVFFIFGFVSLIIIQIIIHTF